MEERSTSWNSGQLFSSSDHDWVTPQDLFDALSDEFGGFDMDAAAKPDNAKCANYISPGEDSLTVDWSSRVGVGSYVWLNPPYGRGVGRWLQKAYEESLRDISVVVLIMARCDTAWWHDWAMKAAEIRMVRGRIHFSRDGKSGPAPAPSAILIYSENHRVPVFRSVELPRGNR